MTVGRTAVSLVVKGPGVILGVCRTMVSVVTVSPLGKRRDVADTESVGKTIALLGGRVSLVTLKRKLGKTVVETCSRVAFGVRVCTMAVSLVEKGSGVKLGDRILVLNLNGVTVDGRSAVVEGDSVCKTVGERGSDSVITFEVTVGRTMLSVVNVEKSSIMDF